MYLDASGVGFGGPGTVQRARSMAYAAWDRTEHGGQQRERRGGDDGSRTKGGFTRQPAFYTGLERLIGDVGFGKRRGV